MAAILQRQPLTIKQQVEELKNWHKQQQSKLESKTVSKESSSNKENVNREHDIKKYCNSISSPKVNFDEIPIKVVNNNFNTLVENNVAPTDSNSLVETGRLEMKADKPKFSFLKKGEGIARFNMRPPKISKKTIPKKQNVSLKLTKDSTKSIAPARDQKSFNELQSVNSEKVEDIPTLKVPDVKLNFTWKSILSGGDPEDMLEKAINSNQLKLMDLNSSIDSSTASLMEKLLAIGKNKLSRDREELRVFETIEQHMLDSSFCSTSSYVNKLMENAVMSTPDKENYQNQQPQNFPITWKHKDELPGKVQKGGDISPELGIVPLTMTNPSLLYPAVDNHVGLTNTHHVSGNWETKSSNNQNSMSPGQKTSNSLATRTTADNVIDQDQYITLEESVEDLEQSLHVHFAEQVDYKSFVEQSQSIGSESQKEENESAEFDESQEWKEDSEDSSSCCSQCSKHETSIEDDRLLIYQEKKFQTYQCHSQSETTPKERFHVDDLTANDKTDNENPQLNEGVDNFPPLLLAKLKELEEEIKIFREENQSLKSLRESLEKERRSLQEEKRHLNFEKKKLKKEMEEEQKRIATQFEEEKQKLAKEKSIFEKYSKSLTKNPSREERKEIQALREQLSEMKEELNKKESRWGAAQARVRNQVKVLEEDNKNLRGEIENFRKQAKYWDLFNHKKKGKPFNNTKLIHAISEHISNIVLDDVSLKDKSSLSEGYFTKNSSDSKTSTITQTDLKSMYGIKVIKENNSSSISNAKCTSDSNTNSEGVSSRKATSDVVGSVNGAKNMPQASSPRNVLNLPTDIPATHNKKNLPIEDRCQKPGLEEDSGKVIKEVFDESGNVEIIFNNGNIKRVNTISGSEKYIYINGDVEEITQDGTVKYYYSKSRIWQTTLPDGFEIVDFPDGKVEKRHVDGTIEIFFSNNNKKITYPDGSQEIMYTDGTRLKIESDKTQVLILPNGQKEIHTEEWKRREYPDGTMKTLYPDGTTETVYSNGRVRLKDKYGNLVMDSGSPELS